ncbi:MAG: flagellar filament capping protein FliD [Butyricicoccus sp.]|nr:flagellar filament capping protein FliD [Butyricicoccus sp.]
MAVSSVSSSSSSSSIYGNRNVISGLASGMDTESMIENMVSGIKSKIDSQKQDQQILLWQQEAYRSISDQLVQISQKYTSYTSTTNLMSSSFFQPSIITSLGKYADMISASGSTNSDIEIGSVDRLSRNETITFHGLTGQTGIDPTTISAGKGVSLTGKADVSNLAGQQLSFQYGNKTFSISFDSNREYKDLDDVVDEINKQLGNASITLNDDSITMDSKVKAQVVDSMGPDGKPTGEQTIAFTFVDGAKESNTLEVLSYSSTSVLNALHLSAGDKLNGAGVLASRAPVTADDLTTSKNVSDVLAGSSMNVTYNGTTATIKMPEKGSDEYKAIFGTTDSAAAASEMTKYLQTQFDQAFGYGRVTVENAGKNGTFQPTFSVSKESDTLSIDSGTLNVIGKGGILGIDRGASNRVNTSKTLGDLYGTVDVPQDGGTIVGLGGGMRAIRDENNKAKVDENGKALYAFEINGVKIGEYTADTTLETIMNDINDNTKAGVKVTYSATADQFVFSSTHGGEGGRIAIGETTSDGANNIAAKMFGSVTYDAGGKISAIKVNGQDIGFVAGTDGTYNDTASGVSVIQGQDAQMTAYINGVKTTLTSATNTFNIDGFNVTANGTFTAETGERVSFNSKVDTDKIVDAIKSFVEDYNKVLAEINDQYSTQPDHKKEYLPLTDDQKADMSDKQIEEYEAKAKEGILFNDRDLGNLANSLRFVFSDSKFSEIGIDVSSSYSDKGKISLDESKLRAMLESNPEKVSSVFSDPLSYNTTTDSSGNKTSSVNSAESGVMAVLKVQLDKYAATTGATKGILIEKAGSQYSPLALLQNTMQTQIDDIDDVIDSLTEKLNDKIDYYTSKFTQLETLIAQMNSQSSYLSSLGGSSY